MKKAFLFILTTLFVFSCQEKKELKITKGVSLEIAQYRKKQIDSVFYQLSFDIPKELSKNIPSKEVVKLYLNDLQQPLIFDFNEDSSKIHSVVVNGEKTTIQHQNEHLIIAKKHLKKGENTIEIRFDAGEQSLNRNEEFLYTLLVPDRASTLFPCFDQPDLKATFQLTIKAPKEWKVLCGAKELKQEQNDETITHYFGKTDKMSTYLFSFVAGVFSETTHGTSFPMKFLYRENNQEKIAESTDAIFDIHSESLTFLEKYTAYPFPFQKLDFASIPPFQYGGMEHVGAIQYRESALFLDKNASERRKIRRAKLIAHETAHMWFGDLVTMRWFDDVWLKEVFANFMADKIVNPLFPNTNHQLNFMMTHYPSAYSEDRTKGTNPIKQQLSNLKNAGSLYGRIIYNKAPIMMRQLELLIGKEKFKEGIQEYIKTYANGNADWSELVGILDQKSPKDVTKWSKIWVNSSGRPIFTDRIQYQNGKISDFTIYQKAEDGSDKVWQQQFSIGLVYKDHIKEIPVSFLGKSYKVEKAINLSKPKQVIYNYNGFGYGVFPINSEGIVYYKNVQNDASRGSAFINLYENTLTGTVPVLKAYNTFLDALTSEKNELIASYISGSIRTLFWKFLTPQQREKVRKKTENTLFTLLQKDVASGIKRSYLNTYKSIAFSEKGKENLYQIWNGKHPIKGVVLNQNDRIGLAMQLAIFEHPKAKEILKTQEQNIKNKDRLARFQWLLPALSNEKEQRKVFMRSLADKKNREKEEWVETALSCIHHPLRQSDAIEDLPMCLNLLEEIQLTGDIFFPKNWLANSVGNYNSKKAQDIVETYLSTHKNINKTLKNKLLQVVDDMYRFQELPAQNGKSKSE